MYNSINFRCSKFERRIHAATISDEVSRQLITNTAGVNCSDFCSLSLGAGVAHRLSLASATALIEAAKHLLNGRDPSSAFGVINFSVDVMAGEVTAHRQPSDVQEDCVHSCISENLYFIANGSTKQYKVKEKTN